MDNRRWLSFIIAIVCGLVASFSFANGLLYWLIGTGALLVEYYKNRWSITYVLIWLVVSVVVITGYMYDFKPVGHHPPITYSLSHPLLFFSYIAVFLGSPICQIPRFVSVSFMFGLVGIILIIYLIRKLLAGNGKELIHQPLIFWHCLLMYSLLSDFITALGRSGFGINQALSSRYVTISNFFWIWIIVVIFRIGQHRLNTIFSKILSPTAIICSGFIVLSMVQTVRVFILRKQLLERNEAALRADRYDYHTLRDINDMNPALVPTGNRTMQKNKLSFYWSK